MAVPCWYTRWFNVHQYSAWPFHDSIFTDSMFINIQHGRSMTAYSWIQCSSIFCMAVPWQHTHWCNTTKVLHGCSIALYSLIQCLPRFCMAVPCQYTQWFNAYQYSSRLLHAGILTDSMFTNILHGRSMTAYPPMQCNQDYAWLFYNNIQIELLLRFCVD